MKLLKFDSLEAMKSLNFINVKRVVLKCFNKVGFALLLTTLFLVSCENKTLKTGYIDLNQINKEYKLAVALEEKIRAFENKVASDLLGMQADVNLMQDSIKSLKESGEVLDQAFLKKYFDLNNAYEKQKEVQLANVQDSVVKYREKLISNINKLVKQYAQKEHFHYVFSPAGSSAFMYGDTTLNITKQVIAYLNSK